LTRRLPIKVLRQARRQIDQASDWWRRNRSKAPDAFREEMEKAFDLLSAQPHVGVEIADFEGVRRLHLSRIHYYLYFRPSARAIEIVALWHTSRGSSPRL
jgi:plasmid stabilization system protein ParE